MAKEEAPAEETAKPKKKKGKKKLVILLLVLLLAGGGGYVVLGKKKPANAATPGPVETVPSVTLNLADGHYLQVGLAVQLDVLPKATPQPNVAKITNTEILYLGDLTYAKLLAKGGRAHARSVLTADVQKMFPKEVQGLYFTQFVMQ